jgi:DNA-directed RNA polymerase subunit K/omega
MSYKTSKASKSTITRSNTHLEEQTGNIYESINIIARRANQINLEMKTELLQKLEDFSILSDNMEDHQENSEQIEISKYYERLPKPTALALEEYEQKKIFWRHRTQENQEGEE